MDIFKGLTGNLAVLRLLVVRQRDYSNPQVQQKFDTINRLFFEPANNLSIQHKVALADYINETIDKFEYLRDFEEETQGGKENIEVLIEKLHQIKVALQ
jgi:hypothetical protein